VGIPLIKSIPFTLGVHGGALWASSRHSDPQEDGRGCFEARKPYSEIGFSLGNLTPFLSILNFGVYFYVADIRLRDERLYSESRNQVLNDYLISKRWIFQPPSLTK